MAASSRSFGIEILSMPVEQTELEKEIRELAVKQTELEKENREFKQLLSGGKFREGGENRKSTVTFLDVESRNSIDITAENDHAPGSGHIGQVQLYPDVKEIPSKADDEVEQIVLALKMVGQSAAFYFVTAGLIFVVCSSLLLLTFIPKVRALRKKNRDTNMSASSRFSSATSTREGIKILSTPVAQAELERKNRELTVEQAELEKEIRELKRLLSGGKSREWGENQKSSITFLDVESRNSSDSAAENDHARGSVQFSADVKEFPSKADNEVEPNCTSLEAGRA
eukprot:CAMPEP_0202030180 /NCGR_PEP_ID=MMETSP0905-20130828/64364_1 /ASSEMBLY_ACC=CAM_ASM_000554 /TAXON_ID=420261 /ORGANISM="Thalassiosira antarctica, Strain CCMP982" /LENGTH=283 /DNA_ID=CAMNT_0048593973 /DNA_START=88 /DNA_END=940 /DNA_ORIENTATION=+